MLFQFIILLYIYVFYVPIVLSLINQRHSYHGNEIEKKKFPNIRHTITTYKKNQYTKIYECGDKKFYNEKEAIKHLKELQYYSTGNHLNRRRLSLSIDNQLLNNKKKPFKAFCMDILLGPNPFSNKIWRESWKDMSYFSAILIGDYQSLSHNFLTEINAYRKYHKVGKIKESKTLKMRAQKHAQWMAREQKTFKDDYDKHIGEINGKIYYEIGNLIVKKLYDRGIDYDYKNYLLSSKYDAFTQLIWKATTYIGIGISRKDNFIYYNIKLMPKGNIEGKYKYNIFSF